MKKRFETEVRREQIADAALSIIFSEGVNGLTVRKVAEKVGFSAPALYRHYKGKAEILLAVIEDHFSVLLTLISDAKKASTPLEALRQFYFSYIEVIRTGKSALPIFLSEHVRFKELQLLDAIDDCHNTMHDHITELIEQGQDKNIIRRDIESEELFFHYIGLLITPDLLFSHKRHKIDLTKQTIANWKLFATAVAT